VVEADSRWEYVDMITGEKGWREWYTQTCTYTVHSFGKHQKKRTMAIGYR